MNEETLTFALTDPTGRDDGRLGVGRDGDEVVLCIEMTYGAGVREADWVSISLNEGQVRMLVAELQGLLHAIEEGE